MVNLEEKGRNKEKIWILSDVDEVKLKMENEH